MRSWHGALGQMVNLNLTFRNGDHAGMSPVARSSNAGLAIVYYNLSKPNRSENNANEKTISTETLLYLHHSNHIHSHNSPQTTGRFRTSKTRGHYSRHICRTFTVIGILYRRLTDTVLVSKHNDIQASGPKFKIQQVWSFSSSVLTGVSSPCMLYKSMMGILQQRILHIRWNYLRSP